MTTAMLTAPATDKLADRTVPRLAYNLKEAAEALGVSDETLRREIHDGKLTPSACIRGRKVYTVRDLQAYLNRNRIPEKRVA